MPIDRITEQLLRDQIAGNSAAFEAIQELQISREHFTDRVVALLVANAEAHERNWNKVPRMTVDEAVLSVRAQMSAIQLQNREDVPNIVTMPTLAPNGGRPGRIGRQPGG